MNKPLAVDVSGAVARPGVTYLTEDEPLTDAIALAGGLLSAAATARLEFDRGGSLKRVLALGDPILTQPAKDGDTLTVPSALRITVGGRVEHPGPTVLQSNFTLLSALSPPAAPAKTPIFATLQVVHGGERPRYDVTQLTHGDLSQNPTLRRRSSVRTGGPLS